LTEENRLTEQKITIPHKQRAAVYRQSCRGADCKSVSGSTCQALR